MSLRRWSLKLMLFAVLWALAFSLPVFAWLDYVHPEPSSICHLILRQITSCCGFRYMVDCSFIEIHFALCRSLSGKTGAKLSAGFLLFGMLTTWLQLRYTKLSIYKTLLSAFLLGTGFGFLLLRMLIGLYIWDGQSVL